MVPGFQIGIWSLASNLHRGERAPEPSTWSRSRPPLPRPEPKRLLSPRSLRPRFAAAVRPSQSADPATPRPPPPPPRPGGSQWRHARARNRDAQQEAVSRSRRRTSERAPWRTAPEFGPRRTSPDFAPRRSSPAPVSGRGGGGRGS